MSGKTFVKISSLTSALLLILAGITSILEITIPSLFFGFLLVPSFICLVAGLAQIHKQFMISGLLSVVFASMYGLCASFNYFSQINFRLRNIPISQSLEMTNPDSIFWVIEILAYFFMGLATLALIPAFRGTKVGRTIQFLFYINALLGIGGVIGHVYSWNLNVLMVGLMIWNFIMPLAAIMVFFYVRQMK